MLKLMYITNDENVAKIADKHGVDRIFVDLEQIGKQERQGGMDTVQSKHTLDDVKKIKKCYPQNMNIDTWTDIEYDFSHLKGNKS